MVPPRHLGACAPPVGRILVDKFAFQEKCTNTDVQVFSHYFGAQGAPTFDKIAPKTRRTASKMEFGITSHMLTSFCTVLASILEGLGVDCVPLGVHLGSNLAPKNAPEPPKSAQKPPKTCQELSKSRPRRPGAAQDPPRTRLGAAQDSPRACQEPTKMPKNSPGPAQDLLRIRPGPPRTARDPTHYLRLEKKSQLHNAILQNFFPSHKAAEIKNERRRYSPQGGLQSAAQLGTAC